MNAPGMIKTREQLLAQHPEAHQLSVYDGRACLGYVVECERPTTVYAFDHDEQLLGVFTSRRAAIAAVDAGGRRV